VPSLRDTTTVNLDDTFDCGHLANPGLPCLVPPSPNNSNVESVKISGDAPSAPGTVSSFTPGSRDAGVPLAAVAAGSKLQSQPTAVFVTTAPVPVDAVPIALGDSWKSKVYLTGLDFHFCSASVAMMSVGEDNGGLWSDANRLHVFGGHSSHDCGVALDKLDGSHRIWHLLVQRWLVVLLPHTRCRWY
jgi:hypothetical protein